MGNELQFNFMGTAFVVQEEDGGWSIPLRQGLVPVRDAAELDVLTFRHQALLPCRVERTDDLTTLHLQVDAGLSGWDDLGGRPRTDKLRALANVGDASDLVAMGYGVILHPTNLLFDRNLRLKIAYRGLGGVMPPAGMDGAQFLRQYQALVLATMDTKSTFNDVFDGSMTLKTSTEFERKVTEADSPAALSQYLDSLYDEEITAQACSQVRVSRRAHRTFKQLAIWLGVAAVAATAGVAYYTFSYAPFQERMLSADMQFVAKDYEAVIETLKAVDETQLPTTQRYELAFSYVYGAKLTEAQQTTIENTISLSAEPAVLRYWVQVGRGQLDAALDTAKGLNDTDLTLYAITLLQEQVKADPQLSGTQREARLEELTGQYDKYFKSRNAAVEQPTPTPTPTRASTTSRAPSPAPSSTGTKP